MGGSLGRIFVAIATGGASLLLPGGDKKPAPVAPPPVPEAPKVDASLDPNLVTRIFKPGN